jgi:hypothetical protein
VPSRAGMARRARIRRAMAGTRSAGASLPRFLVPALKRYGSRLFRKRRRSNFDFLGPRRRERVRFGSCVGFSARIAARIGSMKRSFGGHRPLVHAAATVPSREPRVPQRDERSADDGERSADHWPRSADDEERSADLRRRDGCDDERSANDGERSADHRPRSANDEERSAEHRPRSANDEERSADHWPRDGCDEEGSAEHRPRDGCDEERSAGRKDRAAGRKPGDRAGLRSPLHFGGRPGSGRSPGPTGGLA